MFPTRWWMPIFKRCCKMPCNCWMPESVCLSMILGNALGRSLSPSSNSSWCICFTDPRGSRRKPSADDRALRPGNSSQLQLRGEADAAYHPAGINHARPAQKKSAEPVTLLVFEMYARQKNLTRLERLWKTLSLPIVRRPIAKEQHHDRGFESSPRYDLRLKLDRQTRMRHQALHARALGRRQD